MHISEGVLSPVILGSGWACAAAGTWLGLRKLDTARLAFAAVLSSAFFVASLIHVPLGPGNVHLILNGLLGLFLGWAAFPALLTALLLQALLFRYGGMAVLGVNVVDMALPAVICHYLFRSSLLSGTGAVRSGAAFLCGALSVAGASIFTALALSLTDEGFVTAAKLLVVAHLPVMVIEGGITALALTYVAKNRPQLLHSLR